MEKEIIKVIKYFTFFSYTPSFEEIYTFLAVKISKKQLLVKLEELVEKGVLIKTNKIVLYTLPQYSNFLKNRTIRTRISLKKINKIRFYVQLLSFFPEIRFVGLSGTLAMFNAQKKDDIDLCIICNKNRLWTGRFIAIVIAQILGFRRRRNEKNTQDKVCLNLFFVDNNLQVPEYKKTEYVAHEVLQLRPLLNKNLTYERFLKTNEWVYEFFPNARQRNLKLETRNLEKTINRSSIPNICEFLLKKIQLYFINKHRTNEIITDSQLWFFPKDFEEKLPV